MFVRVPSVILVGFASALSLVACQDKAQPDYAKCVQAEVAGDLMLAWMNCNTAVDADPNSASGKAAAAKLVGLKPKYEAWKADRDAKEAAAAAARAKAEATARAQAAAAAREKVSAKYWGFERDDQCTAKGLPPFRKDYGGGTLAEDQMVQRRTGVRPYSRAVTTPRSLSRSAVRGSVGTSSYCPRPGSKVCRRDAPVFGDQQIVDSGASQTPPSPGRCE